MGSKMTKLCSPRSRSPSRPRSPALSSSSSSSSDVVLSKTTITTTRRPFILVPLYIYPHPGAWEPLITAARGFPQQEFVVVVNPDNGPGEGERPDENYVGVLHELRGLSNIRLVGYVYCGYGRRDLGEMEVDIGKYQGWAREKLKGGCGVEIKGIFFDEAPSGAEHVEYMASASSSVRDILSPTATVVYNPGIFPDYGYYDSADYVVPFENAAGEWGGAYVRDNIKMLPRELRGRSIVIAHSCGDGEEKKRILREVKREGWGGIS
ncbi:Spherulation-specific family 4-domain-containing protein [Apiosordaria backusii]|uniref:Spherulation-specific family 4-domain-containing protein n=1 Tax=Apiosordaria backusii TaxID=314023 RepID=A0AA40DHG9_9PEZI|nr:Spherulation-specific family 4-domain-containing protein [Apiosordaria backusii]